VIQPASKGPAGLPHVVGSSIAPAADSRVRRRRRIDRHPPRAGASRVTKSRGGDHL